MSAISATTTATTNTVTVSKANTEDSKLEPQIQPNRSIASVAATCAKNAATGVSGNVVPPKVSSVQLLLNDIDNIFASLTNELNEIVEESQSNGLDSDLANELNAKLEEEKRVGPGVDGE